MKELVRRRLQKAGVRSTAALLKHDGTAKGRKELAAATNINERTLLKWVIHADLFRVRGIGSEYSNLLEAAGVDTVPELRQRSAKVLHEVLVKANETKKLAKTLAKVIEY